VAGSSEQKGKVITPKVVKEQPLQPPMFISTTWQHDPTPSVALLYVPYYCVHVWLQWHVLGVKNFTSMFKRVFVRCLLDKTGTLHRVASLCLRRVFCYPWQATQDSPSGQTDTKFEAGQVPAGA